MSWSGGVAKPAYKSKIKGLIPVFSLWPCQYDKLQLRVWVDIWKHLRRVIQGFRPFCRAIHSTNLGRRHPSDTTPLLIRTADQSRDFRRIFSNFMRDTHLTTMNRGSPTFNVQAPDDGQVPTVPSLRSLETLKVTRSRSTSGSLGETIASVQDRPLPVSSTRGRLTLVSVTLLRTLISGRGTKK